MMTHNFGHTAMAFWDTDYALIEYTVYGDDEVHWIVCPHRWNHTVAMHRLSADASVATITERFN